MLGSRWLLLRAQMLDHARQHLYLLLKLLDLGLQPMQAMLQVAVRLERVGWICTSLQVIAQEQNNYCVAISWPPVAVVPTDRFRKQA